MNSIQNIVDKIIKEAEDYSKEKTALANAEKDEMLSKAKSEADSIVKLAEEEAKRGEKAQKERAEASCASIIGNAILKTKVEILDSVFETAAKSLREISDADFVKLMTAKIKEAQPTGATVLVINPKRKATESELLNAFKQNYSFDCSVKCDGEINGMLIVYGDVTADCSFESLVKEQRARLEAETAKLLFEE